MQIFPSISILKHTKLLEPITMTHKQIDLLEKIIIQDKTQYFKM